jgi:predicted ATP-dependent protease
MEQLVQGLQREAKKMFESDEFAQAIGGINYKIEGFYDVCRFKGLTGDQGVLMPKANLRNLMLRSDVVQAVKDGKFHIYAVSSIDEGIEVLTDVPAGERDSAGHYPAESINGRAAKKLLQFADQLKQTAPIADRTETAQRESD